MRLARKNFTVVDWKNSHLLMNPSEIYITNRKMYVRRHTEKIMIPQYFKPTSWFE